VHFNVRGEGDETGRLGAWVTAERFSLDSRPDIHRLTGQPGSPAGWLLIPEGGARLMTNMGRRTALARSFAKLVTVPLAEFPTRVLEFANHHGHLGLDEIEFVTKDGHRVVGERIKDWERHSRRVTGLLQLLEDVEDLSDANRPPAEIVRARLRSCFHPADDGLLGFGFPAGYGTGEQATFPSRYSRMPTAVDDVGLALMVRHGVAVLILRELQGRITLDILGCDLSLLDRPPEKRRPMALNYLGATLLATIYHQLAVALVSPKAKRWATCPCGRQFRQQTARQRFHTASCRSKYRAQPTSKESTP